VEAVLFIGIQATGKSTFFQRRFFNSHVRINLDMLRTRNRERILLQACLEAKQPFVLDNTNLTVEERAANIAKAREAGFRIIGYYFQSSLSASLERNAQRTGKSQVPLRGVLASHKKLQMPSRSEGFDELWYVRIGTDGEFEVAEWSDEV